MNQEYKAYNQILSARDSEFRLKPQGDKLTLVTTAKILIKRDVPVATLHLFIEGVLLEEFGVPVAVQPQSSKSSNHCQSSGHTSSDDGFTTGLIIGSLLL